MSAPPDDAPHRRPLAEQCWPEGAMPLVSILCNTYNQAGFIRECLDGFLMQRTDFPVEILVHDDASTDGTAEIVREYAQRYPTLVLPVLQSRNQHSQGIRVSANWQWPRVRGRFIAVCEGDDYWTCADKLQAQADFLRADEAYSFCWHRFDTLEQETGQRRPDLNGRYFGAEEAGVEFTVQQFCHDGWHVGMHSLMYRKDRVRFDRMRNPHYRDAMLISELLESGRGYCLSAVMGVYRIHAGGVYSRLDDLAKARLYARVYGEIARIYPHNPDYVAKYVTYSDRCIKKSLQAADYAAAMRAVWHRVRLIHDFRVVPSALLRMIKTALRGSRRT